MSFRTSGERRLEIRYTTNNRVSILRPDGRRHFGIVRDFSAHGLLVALIGSTPPGPGERFDVCLGKRHFSCQGLVTDAHGVHCRLTHGLTQDAMWLFHPLHPMATGALQIDIDARRRGERV
ncbi:MAG TPA: PilZ domain-containing protein [Patescibacteria group bacterium]|nr:PilZ domain-containing protein [Patescibacteria group bacterium]